MGDEEDLYDRGIQKLLSNAEAYGVGVIRVADGHLYAFSRQKLVEILKTMDEASPPQQTCIVFVKTGKDIDGGESDN